jgi:hypothetical protein
VSTTSEATGSVEPATGEARETHMSPQLPVAGEEIHLPGPSLIPFVTAVGITMIVVGTTIDWLWSILGLVVLVPALIKWVLDTRRDIAELPEEHGEH